MVLQLSVASILPQCCQLWASYSRSNTRSERKHNEGNYYLINFLNKANGPKKNEKTAHIICLRIYGVGTMQLKLDVGYILEHASKVLSKFCCYY